MYGVPRRAGVAHDLVGDGACAVLVPGSRASPRGKLEAQAKRSSRLASPKRRNTRSAASAAAFGVAVGKLELAQRHVGRR
jgi:hypothetical protein